MFRDDLGRVRLRKLASFRGPHNLTKIRILSLLREDRQARCDDRGGLTLAQLWLGGCSRSYYSLATTLRKLARYRYLERSKMRDSLGRSLWTYRLTRKGLDYLGRHRGHIPWAAVTAGFAENRARAARGSVRRPCSGSWWWSRVGLERNAGSDDGKR